MNLQYKILRLEDIETILSFEEKILEESGMDSEQQMMTKWKSKWRREALEHYLAQGWSMAAWKGEGELQGYFLAQALLFFQGKTQVLWIEHVSSREDSIQKELVDIAFRMSKEKHLQSVMFNEIDGSDPLYENYKRKNSHHQILEIPTTKGGMA